MNRFDGILRMIKEKERNEQLWWFEIKTITVRGLKAAIIYIYQKEDWVAQWGARCPQRQSG